MSHAIGRQSAGFMLRLPDGMREQIKQVASLNRRSMNAEIVTILEQHIPKTETADRSAKSISAA